MDSDKDEKTLLMEGFMGFVFSFIGAILALGFFLFIFLAFITALILYYSLKKEGTLNDFVESGGKYVKNLFKASINGVIVLFVVAAFTVLASSMVILFVTAGTVLYLILSADAREEILEWLTKAGSI